MSIDRQRLHAIWRGAHLTPPQAEDLTVKEDSGAGVSLTNRLLAYHALVTKSDVNEHELVPHLLAFIAEAPFLEATNSLGVVRVGSPAHATLAAAWRSPLLLESDDVEVLTNVFDFFQHFDERTASAVLERALRLAPTAATVLVRAANHALQKHDEDINAGYSTQAYALSKRLLEQGPLPLHAIATAAMCALEYGAIAEASTLSLEACRTDRFNPFDNVHRGLTVQGRITLLSGLPESATISLLASAEGQLGYGGPSLRLARPLAEAGNTQVVLEFLATIKQRWAGPNERCDIWIERVRAGDFDALVHPGR